MRCPCITESVAVTVYVPEETLRLPPPVKAEECAELCTDINIPLPMIVRLPCAVTISAVASGDALSLEDLYKMYSARMESVQRASDSRTVTRLTDEGTVGEDED